MKEVLHNDSVWSVRDVWLILPARTLVLAGHALAAITLMLRVHDAGYGSWTIAALLGCLAFPTIATMGIAGHLADRYDSRLLLTIGLLIQLAAALGLAADQRLTSTFALAAVLELGQSLVLPVWGGLLPRVVGQERIGQVIAWQQGLGAIAGPAGAAAGGVIYQHFGPSFAFLLTAGTLVVLLVSSWAVRTRRHVAQENALAGHAAPPKIRMLDGIQFVRRDELVWPLFLALVAIVVLVEGINAAEIFLARDVLGATPSQYGLGEVAAGVGGIAGAVLAGRLMSDAQRVKGSLAGFGIGSLAVVGAGAAPSFWVYLACVVVLALGAGVGNAANGALIIGRTPDAERGKVQAGLNGVMRAGTLVALVLGGTAVSLFGPRSVWIAAGLAGVATIGLARLRLGTALYRQAQAADVASRPVEPASAG